MKIVHDQLFLSNATFFVINSFTLQFTFDVIYETSRKFAKLGTNGISERKIYNRLSVCDKKKQVVENHREFNRETHIAFIEFIYASDNVDRKNYGTNSENYNEGKRSFKSHK